MSAQDDRIGKVRYRLCVHHVSIHL